MFDEIRFKNRQTIANYHEIYLKVPIEILRNRDQKGLYSSPNKENFDCVALNEIYEEPKNPDLIFINDGGRSINTIVSEIMRDYLDKIKNQGW